MGYGIGNMEEGEGGGGLSIRAGGFLLVTNFKKNLVV